MTQPDPETRREIEEEIAQYLAALRRADIETISAGFTEDGYLIPDFGPPICDRQAITDWYRDSFAGGPRKVTAEIVEIGADGDLAYLVGQYRRFDSLADDAAISDAGKIVDVFRREAGGRWKKHVVIYNRYGSEKKS
jgi:ketosteroid isomerase-like protein